MSKTPYMGGTAKSGQVVKDIDLTNDPATALPTADADPTLVRRPEDRPRQGVRVVLQRFSSVVIGVHAPGASDRPGTFTVVGLVASVTASIAAWVRPTVGGSFAAVSLWFLVIGTGRVLFMVGLRSDKKAIDHNDNVD
jgi:hypothetical protein